jgi:hypothetical protein
VYGPPAVRKELNSDVLPAGSVAVAVMTSPGLEAPRAAAKVALSKVTLPLASVVAWPEPR